MTVLIGQQIVNYIKCLCLFKTWCPVTYACEPDGYDCSCDPETVSSFLHWWSAIKVFQCYYLHVITKMTKRVTIIYKGFIFHYLSSIYFSIGVMISTHALNMTHAVGGTVMSQNVEMKRFVVCSSRQNLLSFFYNVI